MNRLNTIYIGYDKREQAYFDVLVESIKRNTKETYNIIPLYEDRLRMMEKERGDMLNNLNKLPNDMQQNQMQQNQMQFCLMVSKHPSRSEPLTIKTTQYQL